MHSVIGLAFAVIRGVGTQQQNSLGGKGLRLIVATLGSLKTHAMSAFVMFRTNWWMMIEETDAKSAIFQGNLHQNLTLGPVHRGKCSCVCHLYNLYISGN